MMLEDENKKNEGTIVTYNLVGADNNEEMDTEVMNTIFLHTILSLVYAFGEEMTDSLNDFIKSGIEKFDETTFFEGQYAQYSLGYSEGGVYTFTVFPIDD